MDLNANFDKLRVEDDWVDRMEPAKHFKKKTKVVSSYNEISISEESVVYRYDVEMRSVFIRAEERKERNLTKGPADDGACTMRNQLCYELFYAALDKTDGFGTKKGRELPAIYDCRATMYLPYVLDMPAGEILVVLDQDQDFATLSDDAYRTLDKSCHVEVRVSPNEAAFEQKLLAAIYNAEKLGIEDESGRDRSPRSFLELLTSAGSQFYGTHTRVGAGNFFINDKKCYKSLGDGKVIRPGLSKGVRIVEKDGHPYPALVLDAKSCAFYNDQVLIDSVYDIEKDRKNISMEDLRQICRGLFSEVRVATYPHAKQKNSKSFTIRTFTSKSAQEIQVQKKDFEGSLAEYYATELQVVLKYPEYFCVEADTASSKPPEYYPLEVLHVAPNQRVPLEKTDAKQSQILLKENAIKPHIRVQKIRDQMVKMGINRPDYFMQEFGVAIDPTFMQVTAGIREAPKIDMGNKKGLLINEQKANWTREASGGTFYKKTVALAAGQWLILYEPDKRNDAARKELIRQFGSRMCQNARSRGLELPTPLIGTTTGDYAAEMKKCVSRNVRFVMLIDPLCVKSHDSLKLNERLYNILTQHVTLERVVDVVQQGKRGTLENILNKTHVKLGGLNYAPVIEKIGSRFSLNEGKVLVIGYDVSHPTAMTAQDRRMVRSLNLDVRSLEPSVVGITANCAKNPHEFVGDYHYQAARKESIDVNVLKARIVWIMEMLKINRPSHCRPEHIIILRDGISEGQYSMAVNSELAALKSGLTLVDPDYNPKFSLIVATKRHNKRFFGTANQGYVNTEPGTVIDNTVVRRDVPEFFLQSHFPIQGTVKIPQYNVLMNEADFGMDELQSFVNCLCHTHQIVNLAVSIPAPIYQADELAKRGRNNFNELRRQNLPEAQIPRDQNRVIDCSALTQMLSYWKSPLEAVRFTA